MIIIYLFMSMMKPEMCNRHKNHSITIMITIYEIILGNHNRLQLPLFFVRLPIDCNLMFYMTARENSERK